MIETHSAENVCKTVDIRVFRQSASMTSGSNTSSLFLMLEVVTSLVNNVVKVNEAANLLCDAVIRAEVVRIPGKQETPATWDLKIAPLNLIRGCNDVSASRWQGG